MTGPPSSAWWLARLGLSQAGRAEGQFRLAGHGGRIYAGQTAPVQLLDIGIDEASRERSLGPPLSRGSDRGIHRAQHGFDSRPAQLNHRTSELG